MGDLTDIMNAQMDDDRPSPSYSSGAPDYWCHICDAGLEGCRHEPR